MCTGTACRRQMTKKRMNKNPKAQSFLAFAYYMVSFRPFLGPFPGKEIYVLHSPSFIMMLHSLLFRSGCTDPLMLDLSSSS